RERRASLLDLTGPQIHPRRADDCRNVDAQVGIELAVLDHFQRLRQQRRYLLRRDHDAVFAMDGEDAADQQWIEPKDRHFLIAAVAHVLDGVAARADGEQLRFLERIPELEAAIDQIDARAAAAV